MLIDLLFMQVVSDFDSAVSRMPQGEQSPTLCVIGCGSPKLAKDFAAVFCPVGEAPRHRLFTDPTKELQKRSSVHSFKFPATRAQSQNISAT
jgi:hypothetical protein